MTRYFMTIPEAVQLVIRAGDIGAGKGEVFVLDMGEPVKIVDLAHNMIRLAGYEPERDIAVEFTKPRPGEKLHEELFGLGRDRQPTASKRIHRAVRGAPLDPEWMDSTLNSLEHLVLAGDEAESGRAGGRADHRRRFDARCRRHGAPSSGQVARCYPAVRPSLPGLASDAETLAGTGLPISCCARGADQGNRRFCGPGRVPRPRCPRSALVHAWTRHQAPARVGGLGARARRRAQGGDLHGSCPEGRGAAPPGGGPDSGAGGGPAARGAAAAARGGVARD